MKTERYTEVICKGFCKFYKPGKESLSCGAYEFLIRNLSCGELLEAAERAGHLPDLTKDDMVSPLVCRKCLFAAEDCDFRAGLDSPPCGGYSLVERLLKA